MSGQPVRQTLRPARFGVGVDGHAQHRNVRAICGTDAVLAKREGIYMLRIIDRMMS